MGCSGSKTVEKEEKPQPAKNPLLIEKKQTKVKEEAKEKFNTDDIEVKKSTQPIIKKSNKEVKKELTKEQKEKNDIASKKRSSLKNPSFEQLANLYDIKPKQLKFDLNPIEENADAKSELSDSKSNGSSNWKTENVGKRESAPELTEMKRKSILEFESKRRESLKNEFLIARELLYFV